MSEKKLCLFGKDAKGKPIIGHSIGFGPTHTDKTVFKNIFLDRSSANNSVASDDTDVSTRPADLRPE